MGVILMNSKIVCTFLILLTALLMGCNTISSSESSDIGNETDSSLMKSSSTEEHGKTDSELAPISEEEQLKRSDLVYLILATKKGETEFIGDKSYTIYYFEVLEVIKGKETIDHAYFVRDTAENSNVTSCIDEKLIENEIYKIYLRNRNGKYVTTTGWQSIIKQS